MTASDAFSRSAGSSDPGGAGKDFAGQDFDVVFTRLFPAPRDLVFQAWTDPARMAQWWGPQGFTNPVCELDPQVGGAWRIVMRSPDGIDYPLTGTYLEIVRPERLVMTCSVKEHPADWHALVRQNRPKTAGEPAQDFLWTVTFEDQGGKTRLIIRSHFAAAADRDALVKIGMETGWNQSLDRLRDLLAAQ